MGQHDNEVNSRILEIKQSYGQPIAEILSKYQRNQHDISKSVEFKKSETFEREYALPRLRTREKDEYLNLPKISKILLSKF